MPGTAEHLEALWKGYSGLNWCFLANVVLAVGINVLWSLEEDNLGLIALGALVLFVVVALITLKPNRQIAFGRHWKPSAGVIASVLMGLNSALFCGIVGYIVMQQLAASEIKLYGVQTSFFGFKKKVLERIEELRRQEAMPPPV